MNFQPPDCDPHTRRRRQAKDDGSAAKVETIEVFRGFLVTEATDGKNDIVDQVTREKVGC